MNTVGRIARFVRASSARAVALVLVVAGAGTLVATQHGGAPAAHAAASPRHRALAWPAGSRYVYQVRWESASTRTLFGGGGDEADGDGQGSVAGGALFEGAISVRSTGKDSEGLTTLVYSLDDVRGYALRFGAADLISPSDSKLAAAALRGQEVFVRVDDLGAVRDLSYHHDTPASTRELLSQLTNMMRVTLPAEEKGSTWTAREPTSNGIARVRYDDEGDVLHRTRLSYDGVASLVGDGEADQKLGSHASIELDPKGFVRLIDDHEELKIQRDEVSFSSMWNFRAQIGEMGSFDTTTARATDLDTSSGADDLARERARGRDERLSAGWNLGMIELELLLHENGERVDPMYVPRAAALLRLNPSAYANVVAWFEEPRVGDHGKQLLLDVLSAAGTDEAQAAMRQALASKKAAIPSPLMGALVQRFSFVQRPTPESARFVADVYDRAQKSGDTATGYPAAIALGAVIDHLQGSLALAMELDARLRADLGAKKSQDWSLALLRALGNARTEPDLPAIAGFAADTHPAVREEVARSLRRYDAREATVPLLGLAKDVSPEVGRAAFLGLREQSLTDEDWDTLARDVEAGATAQRADTKLVDLVERRPDAGARGERILRAVAARTAKTSGNMDLIARIDALLPETASRDQTAQ